MSVTFTYLGAKCEYNFETKNLHITSKQSFNSPKRTSKNSISTKHNIQKQDIKSITFKHNNTKLPSYLYYYFANYPNLEFIELEKLDFENVEAVNGFIINCPKLKEITLAHKNAKNLTSIKHMITQTQNTKSITIKHINIPNLKEVKWLFWYIRGSIEKITIEDIMAPNIDFINSLISTSTIKTLDLTKIGNVNVQSIDAFIENCTKLQTLKLNPLTNTKEIGIFLEVAPLLETEIMSKINKIKTLKPRFLRKTAKHEVLDLDKFKDISELSSHLKISASDKYIYPSIKIGRHKIKFSEYSVILENNIPIIDKTEEEIVKEIVAQANNEEKEDIENFLARVEDKKIFKNEKYEKQLKSKLTIIKNLK